MDSFLNFITDNYTYFLIAAGVLTLALIGLIVSGRNKKKKGDNVNVEETSVDINKAPDIPAEVPASSNVTEEVKPVTPQPTPVNAAPATPSVSETIDLSKPIEAPATPEPTPTEPVNSQPIVQPTMEIPTPPIEPVNTTPDEPIVNINPTPSSTFEINQNNNNTTPGNGQ